jgi:hypothetical protein
MDQYLAALVKHDPSLVQLASDVKLVENTRVTPIGKGLWKTSTSSGTTEYKIYVADPVIKQVGYMGVIEKEGKPVQLGVRLKLKDGEITEIDHLVVHNLAIDEEKGLAFAFSIFRHSGEPKVVKITGVPGVTERPNDYGAFDLPAAHIFKIRNGKIYEIEAIGYMAEHGVTNGW